jgi:hypothetical protein
VLSRSRYYLIAAICTVLTFALYAGLGYLLDRAGLPGWARWALDTLALALAMTLFGGFSSYRRYLAEQGEALRPPPRWFTTGVLVVLWAGGLTAMVAIWPLARSTESDRARTGWAIAWLAIAVALMVGTLVYRDWRTELSARAEHRDGPPSRPAA